MKEKISISVEKELLKQVDNFVDGRNVRNRSQAVERILAEHFGSRGISKAIVLMGRSKNISKTGLKSTLDMMKSAGVSEIIMAGGENNDMIFKHLGTGKESGVRIEYLKEKDLRGTAGCVNLAKDSFDSRFIVVAGDTSFTFDLKKMIASHMEKRSIATIGVTAVKLEDSTDSLILEGDRIVHFNYKDEKPTYMTNAGVYIFETEIFEYIPAKGSLERDVFPKLAKEGKLNAYVFYRQWKHNE